MSERHSAVPQPPRMGSTVAEMPWTRELQNEIVMEFNNITRRKDSLTKSFICHYDLKKIWANIERIRKILYLSNPTDKILLVIQERMYMVLSILVAISAEKCLEEFTTRFFDKDTGEPRITDESLPLGYDEIDFLKDDEPHRWQFCREQHMFKPYVIKLRKFQDIIKIDEDYRLPFQKLEEKIGSGSSSTVDRAWISPEYLIKADQSYYGHVSPLPLWMLFISNSRSHTKSQ